MPHAAAARMAARDRVLPVTSATLPGSMVCSRPIANIVPWWPRPSGAKGARLKYRMNRQRPPSIDDLGAPKVGPFRGRLKRVFNIGRSCASLRPRH